jgi:fructose-specific phosphotransferase system IIC component
VIIAISLGRSISSQRACVAMFTGASIAILWQSIPVLKGFVYELVPAFLIGLTLTWLLSRPAAKELIHV